MRCDNLPCVHVLSMKRFKSCKQLITYSWKNGFFFHLQAHFDRSNNYNFIFKIHMFFFPLYSFITIALWHNGTENREVENNNNDDQKICRFLFG